MDVLEWAIDPWGHRVPIHIAWFLIQVAFVSAVAFLIVHAAYVRFFAGEKQWSGTTAPEVVAAIPERVPRHSRVARAFHWLMAASMLTLLFTAFLPKVGVEFDWVTLHWIAGTVLTASVVFHIIHASFWLDFWAIWPDKTDIVDAIETAPAIFWTGGAGAAAVCEVSAREQRFPRRDHRGRALGHRHRRLHDVSGANDFLPPQSVSLHRCDVGMDVCASRPRGRGIDRARHHSRLLRPAS